MNLGVGADLLRELRSTLERAGRLAGEIQSSLAQEASDAVSAGAVQADGAAEVARAARLKAAEEDVRELSQRLVDSEHQVQRLMNLYVATYQLHGSLDPAVVTRTIADVVTNLLGAESFAIVLRRSEEEQAHFEVAVFEGSDPALRASFGSGRYGGGDALVDAALADEGLHWGPMEGSTALAAVPLRVQDRCVGVLALFSLLRQKSALGADDREMLDLLSAHAASALLAARLFADQDRRLKTLESLVRLAQGR